MTRAVLASMAALSAGLLIEAALASGWIVDLPSRVRTVARSWKGARRRTRARPQWPQALLFLAGTVQSGGSIDEALDQLARQAPEPLRSQVVAADGLRPSTTEARLDRIMSDPALAFARSALALYLRTGGRVGRLLEASAAVLQERIEAEGRVRALTAQVRASAWIVAVTPFALGAALSVLAPDLAAPLVTTRAGRVVVAAAVAMVAGGLAISRRLARVEP